MAEISPEKKTVSTNQSLTATGAIGTLLSALVPVLTSNDAFQTAYYAAVPILASVFVYFVSKFINTMESPEDAALRARLNRSLKLIDKQLNDKDISDVLRKELEDERRVVVISLTRIGREIETR